MKQVTDNLAASALPRVDLLPGAYKRRCQRTRRLQRWIALGAVVLVLQLTAFVALRELGSRTRELQRGLADAERQQQQMRQHLEALAAEQAELDKQLELAEHLNRKHRWSELLSELAQDLPPTVLLTRCESDPPKSMAPKQEPAMVKTAGGKPAEPEAEDVANGLVITGVAADHDSVAQLLQNLNRDGRVGRCSLESTMRQPYLQGEGVFFTIRTKW